MSYDLHCFQLSQKKQNCVESHLTKGDKQDFMCPNAIQIIYFHSAPNFPAAIFFGTLQIRMTKFSFTYFIIRRNEWRMTNCDLNVTKMILCYLGHTEPKSPVIHIYPFISSVYLFICMNHHDSGIQVIWRLVRLIQQRNTHLTR